MTDRQANLDREFIRMVARSYRIPMRFLAWDPPRLCVNGREYHRRQQARRKHR